MSPRSEAISEIQRQLKLVPDDQEIITKLHGFEGRCRKEQLDGTTLRSLVVIAVGFLEHGLGVAIASYFVMDDKLRIKIRPINSNLSPHFMRIR
jgi:hypothetical protein